MLSEGRERRPPEPNLPAILIAVLSFLPTLLLSALAAGFVAGLIVWLFLLGWGVSQ